MARKNKENPKNHSRCRKGQQIQRVSTTGFQRKKSVAPAQNCTSVNRLQNCRVTMSGNKSFNWLEPDKFDGTGVTQTKCYYYFCRHFSSNSLNRKHSELVVKNCHCDFLLPMQYRYPYPFNLKLIICILPVIMNCAETNMRRLLHRSVKIT